VTYFDLQQKFNSMLGIKAEDTNSYSVKLLKGILASCTKVHNSGFPGGWIHKNRELNHVKSDAGLISILGWTEKSVSPYKLNEVIFNPVDNAHALVNGKNTIVGRAMKNLSRDGRNMSFQEFRTAVFLTVPRLDMTNLGELDKQSKIEPLDIKDLRITDAYCTNEMIPIVDNINQAFAFKVNIKNPKSKTNLTHYENARGRLLASTANKVIKDVNGTEYSTFSKLPEVAQDYLRKKYRYPLKRKISETAGVESPVVDVVMGGESSNTAQQPSVKKVKLSKGKASEMRANPGRKAKSKK